MKSKSKCELHDALAHGILSLCKGCFCEGCDASEKLEASASRDGSFIINGATDISDVCTNCVCARVFRKEMLKRIRDCFIDSVENFTHGNIAEVVNEALNEGVPALDILEHGLNPALNIVGKRYERGEYFVSDLIIAGEIMKEGVAALKHALPKKKVESVGTILVGTVRGDMHDVGKNLFSTLARAHGFQIIDLGVDVAADTFVEAVRKNSPDIVGLSALLSSTMNYIPKVVEALIKAELRNRVKIIAGGAPITDSYARSAGADAGVNNAVQGVAICEEWLDPKRKPRYRHQAEARACHALDLPMVASRRLMRLLLMG